MIPQPIPLILKPTPLHRLDRMSAQLGIDLWVKRDDLTGFALGGNKGRKLEYLMADAKDAEVVVSCGSAQSNFIRQLAAACSVLGIRCAAAVMPLPYEVEKPDGPAHTDGGNLLLDRILGADIRVYPDGHWEELYAHADALADEYRSRGKRVYQIPVGGSSAVGAYGFVQAGLEVAGPSPQFASSQAHSLSQKHRQGEGEDFDFIVFASSSGSTHVGLQYAFHSSPTQILGIACDPEPDIVDDFARLYSDLERLTGEPRPMRRADWRLDGRFVGAGYGVPSPDGNAAIETLARCEGIFLDPIYSGKAFAGLLALARAGEIAGRVLFWHTGGVPALFA